MILIMKYSFMFIIIIGRVIFTEAKDDIDISNASILQQLLSNNLEKFNSQYLINLEQKITSLTNTVNAIDTNLKLLLDKSQIWELYRHHIDAWDDHMKSIEHKIDLINYDQISRKFTEGKLTNIENLLNNIINKLIQNNTGSTEFDPQEILQFINNEKYEQKEILLRLNNILKHILNVENSNCRKIRGLFAIQYPTGRNDDDDDHTDYEPLKRIEIILEHMKDKLDSSFDTGLEQGSTRSLANVMDTISRVDDRISKLIDDEVNHNSKLTSLCQSTANEMSTFTESSDLLLKKIEKLVFDVQDKVDKVFKLQNDSSVEIKKKADKNVSVSKNLTNDQNENNTELSNNIDIRTTTLTSGEIDEVILEPLKTGCHNLDARLEGVYRFSTSEKNEVNRDFNERYCSFPTTGLGWTVIQRRGPYEIQENFNRSWDDYRSGFGDLHKDFWFGNEFIHRIVYKDSYELRIELEDFNDIRVWAEYSIFQIDSEKYNYNLIIGGYRGTVSDSMLYHHNQDFSTYDRRNDKSVDLCCSCASNYGSGWWFDNCSEANLNGIYHDTPLGYNYIGIIWEHWYGDYSLKKTRMLIRPKSIWLDNENDIAGTDYPDDP